MSPLFKNPRGRAKTKAENVDGRTTKKDIVWESTVDPYVFRLDPTLKKWMTVPAPSPIGPFFTSTTTTHFDPIFCLLLYF